MKIKLLKPFPQEVATCLVHSENGKSISIGDLIEGRATLILFIRHFGCIGCSENIGLISPRFTDLSELGVRIIIIGCGAQLFIEGFKERHHLLFSPAEIYSDDSLKSHQAAGLMYSIWGGFRPRALYEMARAYVGGYTSNGIEGDIKQQAGAIFIDDQGVVQLYHRNTSLGDHVSAQKVVHVALNSLINTNPEAI